MSRVNDSILLCGGGFFHASCGSLRNSRFLVKHRSETICCFLELCCSLTDSCYSSHCAPDRIAIPCCILGVMKPECRLSSATNVLCFWEACSLPLHEEYVQDPTWGAFGYQCSPKQGFALPPPIAQVIERPKPP